MKLTGHDEYTFASGKKLYINRGIWGLGPELTLTAGYDNGVCAETDTDREFLDLEFGLNLIEVEELCDYMIDRWKQLRHKAVTSPQPQSGR